MRIGWLRFAAALTIVGAGCADQTTWELPTTNGPPDSMSLSMGATKALFEFAARPGMLGFDAFAVIDSPGGAPPDFSDPAATVSGTVSADCQDFGMGLACFAVFPLLEPDTDYAFAFVDEQEVRSRAVAARTRVEETPDIFATDATLTLDGPPINSGHFGASFAGGHLNNDGVEDLIVGLPGLEIGLVEPCGPGGVGGTVGSILFLFGGNVPTPADAGAFATGTGGFGRSIAMADITGNGTKEVLVGAPGEGANGAVTLLYAGQNGPNQYEITSADIQFSPRLGGAATGFSIASLSLPTESDRFIVGSPLHDAAFIDAGTLDRFSETGFFSYPLAGPGDGAQLGHAMTSCDFNGDLLGDLLVTGTGSQVTGSFLQVYLSETPGEFVLPAMTASGLGEGWGEAVACANLDTNSGVDVVVSNPTTGTISVFLRTDPSEPLPAVPTLEFSFDPGERVGTSLATGDVNADGIDDLLVGAPSAGAGLGDAYLYYGPLNFQSTPYRTGPQAFDSPARLGYAATLVDLNDDGARDIVLGAPCSSDLAPEAGGAQIHMGEPAFSSFVFPAAPVTADPDANVALAGWFVLEQVGFGWGGETICSIDWGDRTSIDVVACDAFALNPPTHRYSEAGVYAATVTAESENHPPNVAVGRGSVLVCIGDDHAARCQR